MTDFDYLLRVSDLDNPDSEISEALTQHAEAAVTTAVGPQVQAAHDSAEAAQGSAEAAAGSAEAAAQAADSRIAAGLASGGVIKAADDATLSAAKSYADSGVAQVNTWFLRGNGSPVGIITPTSAGVQYVDLAATNGASIWISTGTTASAWRVVDGDTGVRTLSALVNTSIWDASAPLTITVRRVGFEVFWNVSVRPLAKLPALSITDLLTTQTIDAGFSNINASAAYDMPLVNESGTGQLWLFNRIGPGGLARPQVRITNGDVMPTNYARGLGIHFTKDQWPTTLPGTPA